MSDEYRVRVTRTITEECNVVIVADSFTEAKQLAEEKADDESAPWLPVELLVHWTHIEGPSRSPLTRQNRVKR